MIDDVTMEKEYRRWAGVQFEGATEPFAEYRVLDIIQNYQCLNPAFDVLMEPGTTVTGIILEVKTADTIPADVGKFDFLSSDILITSPDGQEYETTSGDAANCDWGSPNYFTGDYGPGEHVIQVIPVIDGPETAKVGIHRWETGITTYWDLTDPSVAQKQ